MPEQFTNAEQAAKKFMQFFGQAMTSDKWMALTCRVENNQVHLDRVTWNFPIDFAPHALTKIVEDLKSLTPNEPQHPSLRVADFLAEIQGDKQPTIEDPQDTQMASQANVGNDPEPA